MSDETEFVGGLTVITECPEHGLESIEAEAVVLVTSSRQVFAISEDPTGGLLVSVLGGRSFSVGILRNPDETPRTDALVLVTTPMDQDDIAKPPGRKLN